tara:strand:+ start:264 stop:434 length:171 start_codon:yes stop_codon:yes gene_type:complete
MSKAWTLKAVFENEKQANRSLGSRKRRASIPRIGGKVQLKKERLKGGGFGIFSRLI